MLRSDLCDYSDAYNLVKGKITVTKGFNNNTTNNTYDKKLSLKMYHLFHAFQKLMVN